jgi:hypothetical protein
MAVSNTINSRLNLLFFLLLPVQQRAGRSEGSLADFALPSLSWREWSHPEGKRQRQQHKDGSNNIGSTTNFSLFSHDKLPLPAL